MPEICLKKFDKLKREIHRLIAHRFEAGAHPPYTERERIMFEEYDLLCQELKAKLTTGCRIITYDSIYRSYPKGIYKAVDRDLWQHEHREDDRFYMDFRKVLYFQSIELISV
jgi:hypothetical protein